MFLQNFHLIDYNMLVFTIIILARRLIAAIVKEVRIQLLAFVSLYFLLIQGSQKHLTQKDCTPFFFFRTYKEISSRKGQMKQRRKKKISLHAAPLQFNDFPF